MAVDLLAASAVVGVQFFSLALLLILFRLMLDGFWSKYLSLDADWSLLAYLMRLLAIVLDPPLALYLLRVPSLLTLWAIWFSGPPPNMVPMSPR